MFYNDDKFKRKYHATLSKIFAFNKAIRIFSVDFQKPWWVPIWDQKMIICVDLISEIIQSIFNALTPLVLGYAIFNQNYDIILAFGAVYLVIEFFNRILLRIRAIYTLQTENSINYQAYKFFLTIDPTHHTAKSSGQIVSKIERASRSYGDLVNIFLGDVVYTIISFVTIIVTLTAFNLELGLISAAAFVILAFVNAFLSFINSKALSESAIKAQDKKTAASVETLQQNALIRSSFATYEQNLKIKDLTFKLTIERAITWLGAGLAITLNRVLFLIAILILSHTILDLVKQNQMQLATGTALIITFLGASGSVLRIGSMIRNLTERYIDIVDLFAFIRGFGSQTYPVLEENSLLDHTQLALESHPK